VLPRERSFPLKSIGQARATRKMLDQLEKSSSPEQRLFVGPLDLRRTNYNDTFIYHLMLQLRPATYFSQSHQTKWCDLDLRFAARTEPTCSAVAGKMEAKVTASGAGLVACF